MILRLTIAAILGLCPLCQAQDEYPTSTSPVPGGRYEIVQSPILARDTFKLDRVQGRVWRLVVGQDGKKLLESMHVRDAPLISSDATGPRFQLFLSGIQARDTFLIDSATGMVWIVTTITDSEGKGLYDAWIEVETSK
jgi:hypothetical protein